MAVNQPLKGYTTKQYSVLTNFDGGIDRNTADDVSRDNTFKELINFTNANEGSLSKRPGVYNSFFSDFIGRIANGDYSKGDTTPISFEINENRFGEGIDVTIPKLKELYDTIFLGKDKEIEVVIDETTGETESRAFYFKDIVEFQIIENNNFLEKLQNYNTILDGVYPNNLGHEDTSFACIIIARGNTDVGPYGLYVTRLKFNLSFNIGREGGGFKHLCNIEISSVDPTKKPFKAFDNEGTNRKYLIGESLNNGPIDVVSYNGYTYIPTARNYILKIDQYAEDNKGIFQIIGGNDNLNIYEPTPIELTKVGFNILSSNPLTCMDLGTTKTTKLKGVFYAIPVQDKLSGEFFEQPLVQVPYNKEFHIYPLYTGDVKPTGMVYRPNNGETDEEKNPYKNVPGSWATNAETGAYYYNCTGFDKEESIELKITIEDKDSKEVLDTFIAYPEPGALNIDVENGTGLINEISKLVFSSTRMKVIGEQLVLYGGHGYLFFSDFSIFNYFPNYYNLFASNEAHDEEVNAINYFRQYYAVFTNRRIKKLVGSFGSSDFGLYPLNDFVGCANGYTVKAVGSNLLFLGNDGIYKLKQGYLGEGTENVEKIDIRLGSVLNISNVLQAFVIGSHYIVVKNDGKTWMAYNYETDAFYEYNLEGKQEIEYIYGKPRKHETFKYVFETSLYDTSGNFIIVPMYSEDEEGYTNCSIMTFRFADLDYLLQEYKHKDGQGYISTLETHNLNMGYPTNTKKFKEIYIKTINKARHPIPLYVTIYVDDKVVINPEHYEIKYNKETNTYYYVSILENNAILGDTNRVLGELILGESVLGEKTVQQIRFRIGESGRAIKIILSDGIIDKSQLDENGNGFPERKVNLYNFEITSIGIVYKVKKVKEG